MRACASPPGAEVRRGGCRGRQPLGARIDAVNRYLFGELGYAGNREQFDDPRNSCLNEVMDRKKGIPITMALIYIEVARRAAICCTPMTTVRWGIVGCGDVTEVKSGPGFQKARGSALVAVTGPWCTWMPTGRSPAVARYRLSRPPPSGAFPQ